MTDKALYTAASNKFFPSLINLLGSIKLNYPRAPKLFVYDLGLAWPFRRELQHIENVELIQMPHFCPFWRSCFTWKTYIFAHPLARLNFYMDAGSQVLRPLDEIFDFIERDDYFCVEQNVLLSEIAPVEFKPLFPIKDKYYSQNAITAGLFGFKAESTIAPSIAELHASALAGLCLGYSTGEPWKNHGADKTDIIRNCRIFRFDTSVFNLILRKNFQNFKMHSVGKYGGYLSSHDHPDQLIWNLRMNYLVLEYLRAAVLHRQFLLSAAFNRIWIYTFLFVRRLRSLFKLKSQYHF